MMVISAYMEAPGRKSISGCNVVKIISNFTDSAVILRKRSSRSRMSDETVSTIDSFGVMPDASGQIKDLAFQ